MNLKLISLNVIKKIIRFMYGRTEKPKTAMSEKKKEIFKQK